jgi:hypothetical protein
MVKNASLRFMHSSASHFTNPLACNEKSLGGVHGYHCPTDRSDSLCFERVAEGEIVNVAAKKQESRAHSRCQ